MTRALAKGGDVQCGFESRWPLLVRCDQFAVTPGKTET